MKEIQELEEKLKELKRQKELSDLFDDTNMPFYKLADIGYGLKVPEQARIEYEELFIDFVHTKLAKVKEVLQKQLRKKKFVIRIGFE